MSKLNRPAVILALVVGLLSSAGVVVAGQGACRGQGGGRGMGQGQGQGQSQGGCSQQQSGGGTGACVRLNQRLRDSACTNTACTVQGGQGQGQGQRGGGRK